MFNFLPATGNFNRLLITFTNSSKLIDGLIVFLKLKKNIKHENEFDNISSQRKRVNCKSSLPVLSITADFNETSGNKKPRLVFLA